MPLIRKPSGPSAPSPSPPSDLPGLDSADPDDRWAAARAATATADHAARLATAVLLERDPRVREAMFTSLARIGTPASARSLMGMLHSNDAALRTGALDAMRVLVRTMKDLLPELLKDPDVDVRVLSCDLTRSLRSDDAAAMLCQVLAREQDVNVCAAAIDVLSEVGGSACVPAVEDCASRFNASPFLKFAASTAIDRMKAQSGARD